MLEVLKLDVTNTAGVTTTTKGLEAKYCLWFESRR